MGRIIGGVIVGFLAAIVGSGILAVAFIFILGTANIVVPETYGPTALYLGVLLILGVAAHFLGSAIARLIGRDRKTTFWYLGLLLVLGVLGIAMGGAADPPIPKGIPEPSMEMNSWIASFYAQRNMPSWFSIASTVAGVIGVLLGGFGKGDVAKKEAPAS